VCGERGQPLPIVVIAAAFLAFAAPGLAQHEHHPPPRPAAPRDSVARPRQATRPRPAARRPTAGRPAAGRAARRPATAPHEHDHAAAMRGLHGGHPASREASGTAWQPDLARHEGRHAQRGEWATMVHGMADVVADRQEGPRGDARTFSSNMLMAVARRPLGRGTLGLRAMLSAEPATIGREGYPLLLQTGETADGRTHLIDRQHPHDLFMELAASWSIVAGDRSFFVYGGLPGEPALGPPAFMHRFSGASLPAAPLTHHWLDSSHITFGVVTAGVVLEWFKLEASAFRGREPDEERWNIEAPKLDSGALRVSANPAPDWALQVSHGRLTSPEQLAPDVDVDRTTVSVMREIVWPGVHGEITLAWGRNDARPGPVLDAYLAEGAIAWREAHTLLARVERVEKDELFPEQDPRAEEVFDVGAVTLGYRFDFLRDGPIRIGVGGAGTLHQVPWALRSVYGPSPSGTMVFLHVALQ
jgi:hypothetical protein